MAENNMNITRSKLIDSLCALGPIYVMTICIEMDELSWWKYVAGIAALLIVGGVYSAAFKWLICPKAVDDTPITTGRKCLCYVAVFLFAIVGIVLYSELPWVAAINMGISLVVNFALTMGVCFLVAKR